MFEHHFSPAPTWGLMSRQIWELAETPNWNLESWFLDMALLLAVSCWYWITGTCLGRKTRSRFFSQMYVQSKKKAHNCVSMQKLTLKNRWKKHFSSELSRHCLSGKWTLGTDSFKFALVVDFCTINIPNRFPMIYNRTSTTRSLSQTLAPKHNWIDLSVKMAKTQKRSLFQASFFPKMYLSRYFPDLTEWARWSSANERIHRVWEASFPA